MLQGWSSLFDIVHHIHYYNLYCSIWHRTCLNHLKLCWIGLSDTKGCSLRVLPIIMLRPFHASLALPHKSLRLTLSLYCSLASFNLLLNSLFIPLTDVQSPFRNACFFSFRIPFNSLVIQGLLFGKILTFFFYYHLTKLSIGHDSVSNVIYIVRAAIKEDLPISTVKIPPQCL